MIDFNQRIQEIMRQFSVRKEEEIKRVTTLLETGKIDFNDLQKLQTLAQKLSKINFKADTTELKTANNFLKRVFQDVSLDNIEKLQDFIIKDFPNLLNKEQQFCFLESIGCDDNEKNNIILAHGNQENGELSRISKTVKGKSEVYHISKKNKEKKLELESISNASGFKGFCKNHDNKIFEPIDNNQEIDIFHKYFLYSLRSFAHSYYNIKSIQDETLKYLEPLFELSSIVEPFKSNKILTEVFNDRYSNIDMSKKLDYKILKQIKEQNNFTRFEKYRNFLSQYIKDKKYSELNYLACETDHILPIACSSWLRMNISFVDGFMVNLENNSSDVPYVGYPIILSIIPQSSSTLVLLSFFRFDPESKFILNRFIELAKNQLKFELEISNLILQQVDNVYLNPSFWNNLSEENKQVILKGINNRKSEPFINQENQQDINFFDKKYSVNN